MPRNTMNIDVYCIHYSLLKINQFIGFVYFSILYSLEYTIVYDNITYYLFSTIPNICILNVISTLF